MKTTVQHEDPTEIDHGSMYYLMHAGAYKGHMRGIVRGLVVGSATGALIGGAFAALCLVGIVALPATLTMVAIFASFGGMMGADVMGRVGNAAGNAAAQLAEEEMRQRFPELPTVDPNSPAPGYGHHFEVPPDRDRGKFFHGRVGMGAGILGASFGGLLTAAGLGSAISLHLPEMLAHLGHGAAHVVIDTATTTFLASSWPVMVGAVFGLSFGINRSHFKSIFNFTDGLLQGKLGGPSPEELAKDRERYRLMGEAGPPSVITSLQRQEESYRLYEGYYKQAFAAGFGGNVRGLVGGAVAGGVFGTLMGGVAAGTLLYFGAVPLIASMAFVAIVATSIKMAGTHIFNEASFEAAGHSHVHEIFHERMHALGKGHDITFEDAAYNVDLRRTTDPNLPPPTAQPKTWYKPRVGIMLGAGGAAVGAVMAPLTTAISSLLLGPAAAPLSVGASAAVFGLWGAAFGLGKKVTERLHQLGDDVYCGTFNEKNPDEKKYGQIPIMSPNSKLAKECREYQMKQMGVEMVPVLKTPPVQNQEALPPGLKSLPYEGESLLPVHPQPQAIQGILERGKAGQTNGFAQKLHQQVSQPVPGMPGQVR